MITVYETTLILFIVTETFSIVVLFYGLKLKTVPTTSRPSETIENTEDVLVYVPLNCILQYDPIYGYRTEVSFDTKWQSP